MNWTLLHKYRWLIGLVLVILVIDGVGWWGYQMVGELGRCQGHLEISEWARAHNIDCPLCPGHGCPVCPATPPETITFRVHYDFSEPAYMITISLYLSDHSPHYVWPEQNASGWSSAGNGGYFIWAYVLPDSVQQVTYAIDIAFQSGHDLRTPERTVSLVGGMTYVDVDLFY